MVKDANYRKTSGSGKMLPDTLGVLAKDKNITRNIFKNTIRGNTFRTINKFLPGKYKALALAATGTAIAVDQALKNRKAAASGVDTEKPVYKKAVKTLNDQIGSGYSVLGEVDHPDDLKINLDRVSHMIENMWMDGPNGYGKLKILPTPMGQLVKTMLESGVKLGVSSRGSGNISEYGGGEVSDFEIITVDVVAQPSAPGAYPTPIYEHLMNTRGGNMAKGLAAEVRNDAKAQKYLKEALTNIIKDLK